MDLSKIVNEAFDVSKMKQIREIQKNIEKINQFVNANRDATKPIAQDAANINLSFASLLAASRAAIESEIAEKKKKEDEEKKKKIDFSRNRAGVGTTLSIEKPEPPKEANKTE